MLETEFENRIKELKSITHNRGTEFQLWLHMLQLKEWDDGNFYQSWTLFFNLDGEKHMFNSTSYDEMKIKVAEVSGLDHETREMLLSL